MGSFLKPSGLFALAVLLAVVGRAQGVTFLSLQKTLLVTATLPNGGNLTEVHSGQDTIVVTWKLNATAAPGVDAAYRKVRTKLCFAAKSQVLRAWRATNNDLTKDKTCPYDIALVPYAAAGASANFTIPKTVPGASYFVRAYAINATGYQVAFGQTSDKNRTANTFVVIPITGRHASIDIAVGVLSAFSVCSLFGFFAIENIYLKRKKEV